MRPQSVFRTFCSLKFRPNSLHLVPVLNTLLHGREMCRAIGWFITVRRFKVFGKKLRPAYGVSLSWYSIRARQCFLTCRAAWRNLCGPAYNPKFLSTVWCAVVSMATLPSSHSRYASVSIFSSSCQQHVPVQKHNILRWSKRTNRGSFSLSRINVEEILLFDGVILLLQWE
jgi:hypothetical protein